MKACYDNFEFEVPKGVYYPDEDTILLAETLQQLFIDDKSVLEIGCGSGLISILLAKNNAVTAVDVNEDAVKATQENAKTNNVEIKAIKSDLFAEIGQEIFDIIIFNAPYLAPDDLDKYLGKERKNFIDDNVIERFLKQLTGHLRNDGFAILVASSLTKLNIEDKGLNHEIIASKKLPWEALHIYKLITKK
ncbi:MAG: methyltransferase [Candidatus Aenigmarchaeota archaeon]|nr:methyltransferase [Candidatus Aenigmarchaeota archaeon]